MSLPHLFIASSTRSLPRARALAKSLQDIADIMVWKDTEAFPPGKETFTPLLDHALTTDFAIFLFTKDDEVKAVESSNNEPIVKARDNVIFEFGLFFGALGRDRIFTVLEQGVNMPTDLKAMVVDKMFSPYSKLTDEDCAVELREASMAIRKRLLKLFSDDPRRFNRQESDKLRRTLRKLNGLVLSEVLTTKEKFRVELAESLVDETHSEIHKH